MYVVYDDYLIQRIYEGYNTGDQTNFPGQVSNYSGNYDQPSANGPGHTPIHVKGGGPSTGDIIEFPHVDRMTPQQVLSVAQQLVEHEITMADKQDMSYALKRFKHVYDMLSKLQEHDDNTSKR